LSTALDIEAVTDRFYKGLRPHFDALEKAVSATAARNVARAVAIDSAGGVRRVAIRVLTQLLFCYFLQRKRLLAGDRDYLSRAYSQHSGLYYPTVLEPLFYETLAVPVEERRVSAAAASIPFLNGGLFERRYGEASLDLADDVFSLDGGLLGYLNHWTFTVAEETADEAEVAVDPEMLGRIFESLLPDAEREQKGTYYTPRPVVQFMCREALVARLTPDPFDEDHLRTLLSEDDPLEVLRSKMSRTELATLARELDSRLSELTVLDPAVGSGAFLLGMLGEIIRLRGTSHLVLHGVPPLDEQIHAWKLHAIERSLFGVDIEPTAIELCRLRLWLSLAVQLEEGRAVQPLPNLEYRTVCADSLVDFVEGIPIQDTGREVASTAKGSREAKGGALFGALEVEDVVSLRGQYFNAALPTDKSRLRGQLLDSENGLLEAWLKDAQAQLRKNPAAQARLAGLKEQLRSPDRVYPVFMPGFSAPEVWRDEGWDVVIMNPPYVGRRAIPQRYSPEVVRAIEQHYGATHDAMILFGLRALQLTRPGGAISMIGNDSLFTSTDGEGFRQSLFDRALVRTLARTRCFEGQAITGGVIVAKNSPPTDQCLRWIEGFGRPVEDFAGASAALSCTDGWSQSTAGAMEVFMCGADAYRTLPNYPLFRPVREALKLQNLFPKAIGWEVFGRPGRTGWGLLSNAPAMDRLVDTMLTAKQLGNAKSGQFIFLGLAAVAAMGLQTSDDRRFVAAIEDTKEGADHKAFQDRLEKVTLNSNYADEYRTLLRNRGSTEAALLALWEVHGAKRPTPDDWPWPRTGTFRTVPRSQVYVGELDKASQTNGITGPRHWIAFEKGDESQEIERDGGRRTHIAAAWDRINPLVIDWSTDAVALLRRRFKSGSPIQKPVMSNESLWFSGGITWNVVASYFRARLLPEGSVFGHKAPLLVPRPWADWLSTRALLALANSDVVDYILRTFLGSRMEIEASELRRLIIPVLSSGQRADLERFSERAIRARQGLAGNRADEVLTTIEAELNGYVRDLYAVDRKAELWVVR